MTTPSGDAPCRLFELHQLLELDQGVRPLAHADAGTEQVRIAGQDERRRQQHAELRQRHVLAVGERDGADAVVVKHELADRHEPQQRAMAGLVHLGDGIDVSAGRRGRAPVAGPSGPQRG